VNPFRFARVLLAAALLFAQQSALAHQIWHLGAASTGHSSVSAPADDGKGATSDRLCDFHAALGTVLGGASCAAAAATPPDVQQVLHAVAPATALRLAGLPPASRGPPTLS
jgi:hypothetical protein